MIQVSFIIPVYNATPYIQKCLDSIFALGILEDEMEIICVNDCSPDNTAEVITEIAKEHPSVVLINHPENKRQGGGSNTAIRAARGEYAVFMDQDDTILPYDLLDEIQYMRDNDLELLLGKVVCLNQDGSTRYWANYSEETPIMTGPQFFRDELINKVGFGAVWMGIYKTDLIKRTAPFVEKMIYEDTDWCYRCTYNAQRVQYKPLDMYLYHDNPNSSTHNVPINCLVWRVRASQRLYNWAQSEDIVAERDAVHEAAAHFYTWNLTGIGSIWKYGMRDRHQFFKTFSDEEYKVFKQWPRSYWQMVILQYPLLSEACLIALAPLARLLKQIKRLVK